jgi:hypothetical protein
VRGTVEEFIHRVEDRSSLLMMSGHDIEDARLVEFFEFRHLTFQEFLTAQAMVQGWHPRRPETDSLASALLPHLAKEEWREVIPLAAVLGGKATEALIQSLTVAVEALHPSRARRSPVFTALGHCLADEAAARPDTIRAALRELVRHGQGLERASYLPAIVRGRYGMELRNEARSAFFDASADLESAGIALVETVWWSTIDQEDPTNYLQAAATFAEMLEKPEMLDQCEGALGYVLLCFVIYNSGTKSQSPELSRALASAAPKMVSLLGSSDIQSQYAGAFALVWLGACKVWMPSPEPDVLGQLFKLGQNSQNPDVRRIANCAVGTQRLASRNGSHFSSVERAEIVKAVESWNQVEIEDRICYLIAAWYQHVLDDTELLDRCEALISYGDRGAKETLKQLRRRLVRKRSR